MSSTSIPEVRRARVSVGSVAVHRVRVPLRKTIKHASHSRDYSDNVVVRCRLDDGTIGYGEGVPREYVTGETIDTSVDLITRADWSQLAHVDSFPAALEMIQHFQLPVVDGDERKCVGNAGRCAVELALLDAFGKFFDVSLSRAIEFFPEYADITHLRSQCRYSGVITSKKPLRERVSAWKQRIFGFSHCKIKVGTQGQNDVARLGTLRRILGKRMNLRIDANEAWNAEEVVERIRELEPFGITSVEQPVAHEAVDCLTAVREQVAVPIMHDESLCGLVDARRAIDKKTCDLFNIRLSKCGGLLRSFELASIAHQNGLGYQLGCQVGETGILSAAGRHFACSVGRICYLEGSYDSHLVRERLTREDLTFKWGGVAPALTGPGLGVLVDSESLKRISTTEDQVYG